MKRNRSGSSSSQGNTALNMVLCLVVVIVVALIVAPVFTSRKHITRASPCQSNLKQIGLAIKQYVSDWDGMFPTNRLSNAAPGSPPLVEVAIAPPGVFDEATGQPVKFFVSGGVTHISWVGALYRYVEAVTSKDGAASLWQCPAASSEQYGGTDAIKNSAAVTYVINYNLLERPADDIRYASTLMLCRETDRLVASACRGGKLTGSTMTAVTGKRDVPASPFLCATDWTMPGVSDIVTKPHGRGSNILFADGHVKLLSVDSLPDRCVWNPKDKTWGNPGGTVTVSP